jgi:hypothetical protein
MWSIYNGATYYIDVFGKKFQKELEQLKKDVAKWQSSPDGAYGPFTPAAMTPGEGPKLGDAIENIPALEGSTGVKSASSDEVRERK